MEDTQLTFSDQELKGVLECMLFVSPQPLMIKQVAQSLQLDELVVDRVMHELRLDYGGRGIQIIRVAEGYQMCTRPEYAQFVALLLKPERHRLSRAALETLAIVAYRQPITQPEVEAIRGVNSDGVMKTLTERNLIRQLGRRETPGRPMMYATTAEFLNHFGMNDLSELPEIEDITLPVSDNQPADQQAEQPETQDHPPSPEEEIIGENS
ncbi:MAG: SMC-Scp complex subunit ScpB [Armatimonadota bacterium]